MGLVCANQFTLRRLWSLQGVGVIPGCGVLVFTRSAQQHWPRSPKGPTHRDSARHSRGKGVGFMLGRREKWRFGSHRVTAPAPSPAAPSNVEIRAQNSCSQQ